jgi:subtilase family serine protease
MSAATAAFGVPAATAAGTHHAATPKASRAHHSTSSADARSHPDGKVAPASHVSFDLSLALHHPAKATAFVRKVSQPGSRQYHHYLSDAAWEHRFGPRGAEISAAKSWLTKHGFHTSGVPSTRLYVRAGGTAKQVEKAFSTHLGYFRVNGTRSRLATSAIHVPHALKGTVKGVVGVNEYAATPDVSPAATTAPAPPPAGFRNPQPCSAYWGQKVDNTDSPSLYAPYDANRPYDICGYTPPQLRSAYQIPASTTGAGVTIAIVDAYEAPTLLADAQEYSSLNDPSNPLTSSEFSADSPNNPTRQTICGASGWYAEQSLDVEASHAMAPGAHILFVGANNCFNGLLDGFQTAITSGASVVSDSWGTDAGDLLEDAASRAVYDNSFKMAASTGVSVLFSSGDDGDNFADAGIAAADFPPSSPYVTAVGGTSLKIDSTGARHGDYGWSTGSQELCATQPVTNCGSATTPAGSLDWQAGGGGGTSYNYKEPAYQDQAVPAALADRNSAVVFGPKRVEPDVSMDADAQTGMLIGLTQTFPDGVYYDQFKEGGTSLASPLLAGEVADTDQAAGGSLGFLNYALYKADAQTPGAFHDVVSPTTPTSAATIRVNYDNSVDATAGYDLFLRVLDYQGPETYCDPTGNCATRPVSLTVTPGYDSMTGIGSAGNSFVTDLSKF